MDIKQFMTTMQERFGAEKNSLLAHLNDATRKSLDLQTGVNFLENRLNSVIAWVKSANIQLPDHLSHILAEAAANVPAPEAAAPVVESAPVAETTTPAVEESAPAQEHAASDTPAV